MLSDGDSAVLPTLQRIKPYGDTDVKKEECLNHVSKRLGAALRTLVSDERARGVRLGGNRKGSLTSAVMTKLQSYYRQAIMSKMPDVEAARKAIWASILHMNSTDENPRHEDCPEGDGSWCFFKRAMARQEVSRSHKDSSLVINDEVFTKLKPIYERLSSTDLLERCKRLGTQNANESLHSKIWAKCPKSRLASRRRYEASATKAVSEFNMGLSATLKKKNDLFGKTSTEASTALAMAIDNEQEKRVPQGTRTKRRGVLRRLKKRRRSETRGGKKVAYAPGGF